MSEKSVSRTRTRRLALIRPPCTTRPRRMDTSRHEETHSSAPAAAVTAATAATAALHATQTAQAPDGGVAAKAAPVQARRAEGARVKPQKKKAKRTITCLHNDDGSVRGLALARKNGTSAVVLRPTDKDSDEFALRIAFEYIQAQCDRRPAPPPPAPPPPPATPPPPPPVPSLAETLRTFRLCALDDIVDAKGRAFTLAPEARGCRLAKFPHAIVASKPSGTAYVVAQSLVVRFRVALTRNGVTPMHAHQTLAKLLMAMSGVEAPIGVAFSIELEPRKACAHLDATRLQLPALVVKSPLSPPPELTDGNCTLACTIVGTTSWKLPGKHHKRRFQLVARLLHPALDEREFEARSVPFLLKSILTHGDMGTGNRFVLDGDNVVPEATAEAGPPKKRPVPTDTS